MNAVVTYIFGKNAEILREPLVVDSNVDYICVTDQSSLESKHWRIIVDELPQAKCTRDKMPLVKYNPFKYTDAENVVVIDGTLHIINSLIPLFGQLDSYPLLIKKHPQRNNLLDELNEWVISRGMPQSVVNRFMAMSGADNIQLTAPFLIESCIVGYKSSSYIKDICHQVLSYMSFLGDFGRLCITNQCPFTYIVEKFNVPYSTIDQSLFATRYRHNSWQLADR